MLVVGIHSIYKEWKSTNTSYYSFKILVDDNQKKCVCNIILKEKVSFIEVSGKKLSIDDVTVSEITKHKTAIISSAIKNLK